MHAGYSCLGKRSHKPVFPHLFVFELAAHTRQTETDKRTDGPAGRVLRPIKTATQNKSCIAERVARRMCGSPDNQANAIYMASSVENDDYRWVSAGASLRQLRTMLKAYYISERGQLLRLQRG